MIIIEFYYSSKDVLSDYDSPSKRQNFVSTTDLVGAREIFLRPHFLWRNIGTWLKAKSPSSSLSLFLSLSIFVLSQFMYYSFLYYMFNPILLWLLCFIISILYFVIYNLSVISNVFLSLGFFFLYVSRLKWLSACLFVCLYLSSIFPTLIVDQCLA